MGIFFQTSNIQGKTMKKEFHFLLNEKSYEKIVELKKNLKSGISKTIVNIIEQMTPYLEKHGVSFKDVDTRYQNVGSEDEYRKHVHVYMPQKMYKMLKKLHLDINYYSMAQILRHVIDIYLKDNMNLGNDRHMKKMDITRRNWELKKRKKYLRQLSINSTPIMAQSVVYDTLFRPISIRLL